MGFYVDLSGGQSELEIEIIRAVDRQGHGRIWIAEIDLWIAQWRSDFRRRIFNEPEKETQAKFSPKSETRWINLNAKMLTYDNLCGVVIAQHISRSTQLETVAQVTLIILNASENYQTNIKNIWHSTLHKVFFLPRRFHRPIERGSKMIRDNHNPARRLREHFLFHCLMGLVLGAVFA